MFTGLVESLGTIHAIAADGHGKNLIVFEKDLAPQLSLGESVAVNGVCLTVVKKNDTTFQFQVGPETLRCTNLGELQPGDRVNLERAVQVGARLGGHFVQGHVDGLGTIQSRTTQGEWEMIWISCDPTWTRFMVPKGSIAVDGVSLTLVDVKGDRFSIALIPHTLSATTLGWKKPLATVNLEVDILAKYVARWTASNSA